MPPQDRSPQPFGIVFVRRWLPALLVVAAAVVLLVGPRGLAPGLLLTAMFVIVADWIIRFAMSSQVDRDVEASARNRFARSGRWPEESNGDDDVPEDADATSDATHDRHDAPHRAGAPSDDDAGRRRAGRRAPRRR